MTHFIKNTFTALKIKRYKYWEEDNGRTHWRSKQLV